MNDKTFKREQIRRDLQEAVNLIDEASACEEGSGEQKTKDLYWCLKVFPLAMELTSILELFGEVKKGDIA